MAKKKIMYMSIKIKPRITGGIVTERIVEKMHRGILSMGHTIEANNAPMLKLIKPISPNVVRGFRKISIKIISGLFLKKARTKNTSSIVSVWLFPKYW